MTRFLATAVRPLFFACSICLYLLLAAPCIVSAETPTPQSSYTVAVIPFYSPEKIWLLYTPFIQYLKIATGQPWELKLYPDHNSLIEDLCSDKVGIALLGPVPMGRANLKCGVKPFLVALSKDGNPSYHSVMITSDPDVTSIQKVRKKKVGFFKGSTAAHIVPMKMLKDSGLGAEAFEPVFFESQDRIMTALLTKEISAAGVKETLYGKFKSEHLRALKTSEALPNFAFCCSPKVSVSSLERFISALVWLKPLTSDKDAETTKTWDDEVKNGFMLPTEEYFGSVKKLNSVYQEIMHEAR